MIEGLAGLWLLVCRMAPHQRLRPLVWIGLTLIAMGLCESFGAPALASCLGIWYVLVTVVALLGVCCGFTDLFQGIAYLAHHRKSIDSSR